MKPAFDALATDHHMPGCHETMGRIYSFNNQPPYAYNIQAHEHQADTLTPEFVGWDISPLRLPERCTAQEEGGAEAG